MKLIRYHQPLTQTVNELSDWFRDPFTEFEPFSRLLGHRFRDLVGDDSHLPVDLFEDEAQYVARFHLPGVKKTEVKVNLEPGSELVVRFEREDNNNDDKLLARAGRRVALPDDVDPEAIHAKLEDGVLTVTIGKSEAAKPRSIEIS